VKVRNPPRTVRGGGSRAYTRSVGGGEDRNTGGGVLRVDLTRRHRRRGWTRPQHGRPGGRCRRTRHGQGRRWRPVWRRGRARQEWPRDGSTGGLGTSGPSGGGGPRGGRGGPDGGGTGGLGWGVPGDGSGVLVMSPLCGNWGHAGGLGGSGAGLHTHGPSGVRSSNPDELVWPRRRWTSWLHGVGWIGVNGGGDDLDG
jgi:translation initiation factor IF-2